MSKHARTRRRGGCCILGAAALLVGGCQGIIDGAAKPEGVGRTRTGGPSGKQPAAGDSQGGPEGTDGPGTGGSSSTSSGTPSDGGSSAAPSSACDKGVLPGPAP